MTEENDKMKHKIIVSKSGSMFVIVQRFTITMKVKMFSF